ncbi:hypothetical protein DY000_02058506 [Brassica cretica]|uniref:Uncharacterized protein n=1 Tax=Brassica cretica TaxID=69181 RepID=A0ABQ7APA1_BRACR|nr:hypothetical protein DY000_02058506 [Brassica cretica]
MGKLFLRRPHKRHVGRRELYFDILQRVESAAWHQSSSFIPRGFYRDEGPPSEWSILLDLLFSEESSQSVGVTARSPGVRPGLSKGRYGHVSTHLANPTCPVTGPERRAHNLL